MELFLILTTVIGIGACAAQMLVPLTMRIVPIEETGKYVGKVMSGLLIGIMIARPLSIGITEWFGWRMVFLFTNHSSCCITVTYKIFAQL